MVNPPRAAQPSYDMADDFFLGRTAHVYCYLAKEAVLKRALGEHNT